MEKKMFEQFDIIELIKMYNDTKDDSIKDEIDRREYEGMSYVQDL
jgi:hypothetical protein